MILSEIVVTIDTREQNKKRIQSVESWAGELGATVIHEKLDLCDYRIEGLFKNKEVNIGIEAKSLPDFTSSCVDLPDKLAKAHKLYSDVALFVETGDYQFSPTEGDRFHCIIKNPAVRNGDADILLLAAFENMLESLQRDGIHVRQLRSEYHFPYAIAGLLIYCTKEMHSGLHIGDTDYDSVYLNVLAKMPNIGYKRAEKLAKAFPDLFWLASNGEDAYQDVLGKKIGSDLYNFIRHYNITYSSHSPGGVPPIKTIPVSKSLGNDKAQCTHSIDQPRLGRPEPSTSHLNTSPLSDKAQSSPTSTTNRPVLQNSEPSTFLDCELGDVPPKFINQKEIPLPAFKMSAKEKLRAFLIEPHTMQECVDHCKEFNRGTVFDIVMAGCKEGIVTKITDPNKKTVLFKFNDKLKP